MKIKIPKLSGITGAGFEQGVIGLAVLAGIVIVGYVSYKTYKAFNGGALDVTSDNNVAASTVNNIGASVTGDTNWTLGGAIFDLFHSDPTNGFVGTVTPGGNPSQNPSG